MNVKSQFFADEAMVYPIANNFALLFAKDISHVIFCSWRCQSVPWKPQRQWWKFILCFAMW